MAKTTFSTIPCRSINTAACDKGDEGAAVYSVIGVAVPGSEFGFDGVRGGEDRVRVFGELGKMAGLVEVVSE